MRPSTLHEPETQGQKEWLETLDEVAEASEGLDNVMDEIADFKFPTDEKR